MKRLSLALAAVALAACGSPIKHHALPAPTPPAVERCSPADYAMQCAYRAPAAAAPRTITPRAAVQPVSAYGVDFAWSKPTVAWMRRAGAVFAAGYLSTDPSKNLSPAVVAAYRNAGISIVAVWETTAARALDGLAAGRADARAAELQAAALGLAGRPIYFAVDFDTSPNPGAILPYFQGVDQTVGVARAGGYGGLATIRALFGAGAIRYGWQTAAWSGGVWDPRAQLEQYSFGQTLDWDRATVPDYGQTPYAAPAHPPIKPPAPKPPAPKPKADRFAILLNATFPSRYGPVNERLTAEQASGALQHPAQYRAYLHGQLAPRLTFLAQRIAYVAITERKGWGGVKGHERGPRYQILIHAAQKAGGA